MKLVPGDCCSGALLLAATCTIASIRNSVATDFAAAGAACDWKVQGVRPNMENGIVPILGNVNRLTVVCEGLPSAGMQFRDRDNSITHRWLHARER